MAVLSSSSGYDRRFDEILKEQLEQRGVTTTLPPAELGKVAEAAKAAEKQATQEFAAFHSDRFFYRAVALFLGITALGVVAGMVWMALVAAQIPEALVALGSAAIGALAGLLAPRQA